MMNNPIWTGQQPQATPYIEYIKEVLSLEEKVPEDNELSFGYSNPLDGRSTTSVGNFTSDIFTPINLNYNLFFTKFFGSCNS